jgi:hypothetical protein
MATVEANGKTYGWGGDARDLPSDTDAYGPALLSDAEAAELGKAIKAAGWKPSTKRVLEERQVFLIEPGKWRRKLTLKSNPGQILQVVEEP